MKTQSKPDSGIQKLTRPGQPALAYVYTESTGEGKKLPLVMFCGGYRSDMSGTKATTLEQRCKDRGQAYLRFDYSGHGLSEGKFDDGTIGQWKQDAVDVLEHVCESGPAVLVGSSMGGWIALLVATSWKGTLKGLVGIAAAPDFTEDIHARLSEEQKKELQDKGRLAVANDYSDVPYAFTRALYEEAKKHLLLTKERSIDFPISLVQGMRDKDVPWETTARIQKAFTGAEVDVVLVGDGDHRLSRDEDIELIDREIKRLCGVAAV